MEADDVYAVLSRKIKNMQVSGVTGYNETPGTPVGEIISYMGITAPDNYLICDGTEYQIAEYPYLAQHFADHFGTSKYFGGDGETTFAVPDLRGEFLRGSGTGARNTGTGANVGRHQDGTKFPNLYTWVGNNTPTNSTFVRIFEQGKQNIVEHADKEKGGMSYYGDISTTTSSGNRNNTISYTSRPTNTAVLYCIKYKPTYFLQMQKLSAMAGIYT